MLITDDLFGSFLKCKTKAHLQTSSAEHLCEKKKKSFGSFLKCKTKAHLQTSPSAEHPCAPHAISDWQHRLAEDYKRECTDLLISLSPSEYFEGTPPRQDLIKGQHPLIVDPILIFEDVTSHIHALERTSQPVQNNRNHYVPIRFTPYQKVTKNHKLILAYDAFVLGKTFGRMPASGKLFHGRQKSAMTIMVNEFINDVEFIVGKMRVVLTDNAPPDLVLNAHCSDCKFESRCTGKAAETDDLSLLRGIKPKEVVKLRSAGYSRSHSSLTRSALVKRLDVPIKRLHDTTNRSRRWPSAKSGYTSLARLILILARRRCILMSKEYPTETSTTLSA